MKRNYSMMGRIVLFTVGVVFVLQPIVISQDAAPRAHYRVLYTFQGKADGGNPSAGVIPDAVGNLYGTTFYGGDLNCTNGFSAGCGVVFRLDKAGKQTVLRTFTGGPADGRNPAADLIRDAEGNLYGTTSSGGTNLYYGTVFKLDTSGKETVFYNFTGGAGRREPPSGIGSGRSRQSLWRHVLRW